MEQGEQVGVDKLFEQGTLIMHTLCTAIKELQEELVKVANELNTYKDGKKTK